MTNFLITLGGIIVGVIATVLISRHFFKRSLKKSLTPYIQFSSSPLSGIDPNVRKQLEVKYQGHPVDNLYEIQFLIANTGDSAIRDIIEPLTLTIPKDYEILDASILHISPKGRTINLQLSKDNNKVIYNIPLLNSGEFFINKILLNGSPKEENFSFTISADYLPPTLVPDLLPFDSIQTSKTEKKSFEFVPLIIGLFILVLGLSIIVLICNGWSSLPNWGEVGFTSFIHDLGINGWSIIVSILSTGVLLLLGVILIIIAFSESFSLSHKKKFILPEDLLGLSRWRTGFPSELIHEEKKTTKNQKSVNQE